MLETKGLTKIYKPKKGVPVKALDGVSLKFPEKGMVFLLGKSGSGKSTLLNLLGGLDKYDSGEIIIKDVSSKKFKQQHFDSYRNTYVGFIFQEYNILEEFSVGANIALAIELQGRKATDKELNDILNEVDLAGYGNRRPNELSGGQKQRVAIARALVKNPKIIMADEPSGALDSVTGKQVFDTLKKLSKEKLVIVVSHDRDFATEYADRIIELADGKVISDTTFSENAEDAVQGITFEGNSAKIPAGYHITEEDRIAINEYISKLAEGGNLEFAQNKVNRSFVPTAQDEIIHTDKTPFKLIKSKLSLKHAFKIGGSGLKHKKFRLVMTIFLSCIAFVLFGLVDTFGAYDHIKTTANSIHDTGVKYATVSKEIKRGEGIDEYWVSYGTKISLDEMSALESVTGIDFNGVITDSGMGYYFNSNIGDLSEKEVHSMYDLSETRFHGITEVDESVFATMGYDLVAGRMPDGSKNEIVVSKYICDTFMENGYSHMTADYYSKGYQPKSQKIESYADMVGKTLFVEYTEYEIVGVIDTKLNMERYLSVTDSEENADAGDQIIDYVLYEEFRTIISNDYSGMMMVGEGFIDRFLADSANVVSLDSVNIYFITEKDVYWFAPYAAKFSSVNKNNIIWLDGEKETLAENEIIVSESALIYELGCATVNKYGELQLDLELLPEKLKFNFDGYDTTSVQKEGFKIVGYVNEGLKDNLVILSDGIFNEYLGNDDGIYNKVLGAMPESKGDIENLAEYCYTEQDGIRYVLNNPASFELDAVNEVIAVLAQVFLYIGLGFAVFAAILLSNFIATSVAYKKQEIGILRAIGSRSNDVFRIFFAEAFIIAMINFTLACIGTGALTALINTIIREEAGLLVTFLNFGIRQIFFIFAVSIFVAAVASFLPVKKIASKRPIDAIRNR